MESIDVIIETPGGSALKYDYEAHTNLFVLKKMLPLGIVFPYDFGFVPGTKGEDGDQLDVMVLSEFHSFPGCKMSCRVIGGFKAEQSETEEKRRMIRNDRFLAVSDASLLFKNVVNLSDLPAGILSELEVFFTNYNHIEGKEFRVIEKLSPQQAYDLLAGN